MHFPQTDKEPPSVPLDPSAIDPNLCYTLTEAAALVGKTRRTLERWQSEGLFVPAGGERSRRRSVLIRGADLLRLVVGDETAAGATPAVESPARRTRRAEAAARRLREMGVLK